VTNVNTQPELENIEIEGHSRAKFLTRATLAAGALYGAGAVSPLVQGALARSSDTDVLNFALTLEYLEAGYYAVALKRVRRMSSDVRKLAKEIADNEQAHVEALRMTIKDAGAKPVARPKASFGNAFSSEAAFLKTAQALEDTGVSAYNGAAPMISSTDVLAAAGGIVQVEARHAALIRLQRGESPAPEQFDKPMTKQQVLKAVKPFIAA
jgi:rubrerythrin